MKHEQVYIHVRILMQNHGAVIIKATKQNPKSNQPTGVSSHLCIF